MLNSAKTVILKDNSAGSADKTVEQYLEDYNRYKSNSSAKRSIYGGSWDRQDPIDPTEPTDPPEGETYVDMPHPISSDGVVGKTITKAVNFNKEIDKEIAEKVLNESSGSSGYSAKPIIYSDWSPASKLFGMSQETAFSEHVANTAHQREVADLKAAGLNPVLGVSGSGATAVSGSLAGAGGSSSAEKAAGVPWLDVLGATAAVVTTVATKNPMLGYMVSNIFKAFDN